MDATPTVFVQAAEFVEPLHMLLPEPLGFRLQAGGVLWPPRLGGVDLGLTLVDRPEGLAGAITLTLLRVARKIFRGALDSTIRATGLRIDPRALEQLAAKAAGISTERHGACLSEPPARY